MPVKESATTLHKQSFFETMSKIAVFARPEDFKKLRLKPKSLFINVRDLNDIRGVEIIATITMPGWHYDSNKDYAYQRLIERFPKLKP